MPARAQNDDLQGSRACEVHGCNEIELDSCVCVIGLCYIIAVLRSLSARFPVVTGISTLLSIIVHVKAR